MRFSALGDVALTIPVLKAFLASNMHISVVMASEKQFEGLFVGIEGLEFEGFDLKGEYKGFLGIFRIFNLLRRKHDFSLVADLHGVLRTHVLRFLFEVGRRKTEMINKGRIEKYALTRRENKIYRPLIHATERYADVFRRLGFVVDFAKNNSVSISSHREHGAPAIFTERSSISEAATELVKIGFAPFAKHSPKMYPIDKFKEIVRSFDRAPFQLYFFGGKGAERLLLSDWEENFTRAVPFPVLNSMADELRLMQQMQAMVTMDSANMHLASLVNVPVVSLWGPTHPYAGFYGYQQDPLNAVQVNLSCRPCSVFGNSSCWRGDHACMQQITVETVVAKVDKIIKGKKVGSENKI